MRLIVVRRMGVASMIRALNCKVLASIARLNRIKMIFALSSAARHSAFVCHIFIKISFLNEKFPTNSCCHSVDLD